MSIHSEEISDATVRSRRRTQMPRYLEDYEVDYVPEQRSTHTPSDHSNEGEQLIGATGGPLPPHNTLVAGTDHFPAYEGNTHLFPEALQMRLKDLEEENRQLRRNLGEHCAPHTPRSLSPSQLLSLPTHLTRNMEDRTSPPHHRVTSTRDQRYSRYKRERSVKHSEDHLHAERQSDRIDEIIHELQRMKVSSKQSRSTSPSPERAVTPQRAERTDERYQRQRRCLHNCYLHNYLPGLQSRHRWQQEKENLIVGTVVMIADLQFPRALWPTGTVKAVQTGADNKVRAAEIQVKDRTYIRPVVRLIKLPLLPE